MHIETKLVYTEEIVRAAAFASWRVLVNNRIIAALVILSVSLIVQIQDDDRSWLVGALGVILFIATAICGFGYLRSVRGSLARLRKMKIPEALLQADDTWLSASSELGAIRIPWSAIGEIKQYPKFWLLILSKTSHLTVPLANLSAENQEFVLKQVRLAGGVINA